MPPGQSVLGGQSVRAESKPAVSNAAGPTSSRGHGVPSTDRLAGSKPRPRQLVVLAVTAPLLLFGCSSDPSPSATPTTLNSSVTGTEKAPVATTPSGRGPSASASSAPAVTTLQSDVSSVVITTPPEVLAAGNGPTATTALTNDYQPASGKESIVLAAVVSKVTVYESATSNKVLTELANPLPSGAVLNLLVDGQTSSRYKVLLPIRPNGSTGWIDPGQVKKFAHDYRIVVELSSHRITAYKGDAVILSEKIAVGRSDRPTPNGRYYLKELLRACIDEKQPDGKIKCVPNDTGIYGPYAYGLSGFSPTVTSFNGGEGVIGIHGTNQPELLGTDVSSGCIRMSNEGITALSKVLPLGTPVTVTA
jgi:lipoprotein-anchoring transpeptidase ErfK/SrfK